MKHRASWLVGLAVITPLAACSGGSAARGSGGASMGGGPGGNSVAGAGGSAGADWLAPAPDFHDGSRLVARSFWSEGTPSLFAGIYDRQQGVECEFRATPDGKLRCLPANALGPADPATVMPLEQWQEGVEAAATSPIGRLVLNQILSTDGGRFPNWVSGEFRDVGFGQPCRPNTSWQLDGTGDGFCLPTYAAAGGIFFSDAACSQPLASIDSGQTPWLVATSTRALFTLGESYQGPAYIALAMGAVCNEFPSEGIPFYRIGAPLPAGTVAPIRLVPRGGGRLALQMVESEGHALAPLRHRDLSRLSRSPDGPYFDRELNLLCQPAWMLNGEVRCAPVDALYQPSTWLTAFADPACTQPVVPEKRPLAVIVSSSASLPRDLVIEVRRVADTPSATGYVRTAGACGESLKSAGYPLGEGVPPDTYARLDAMTGELP